MKPLVLGGAVIGLLFAGVSIAQTTQGNAPGAATGPSATTSSAATTPAGTPGRDGNAAAASGNNNQAVATTRANAPAPAKGANSFTMGEAKSRLEKNGFSNVGDLAKDGDGVWRGNAQKGGSTTTVWLDYKGSVGEGK